MAEQWFGNTTGDTDADIYSYPAWNNDAVAAFVCPADGALTGLRAKVRVASGSQSIRIALYAVAGDRDFIAQGSAAITVSNTSYETKTHTAFVDRTGASVTPSLTSGTHYIAVIAGHSGTVYCARNTTSSGLLYRPGGSWNITNADAFPATLEGGTEYAGPVCLEIGVTPAATGQDLTGATLASGASLLAGTLAVGAVTVTGATLAAGSALLAATLARNQIALPVLDIADGNWISYPSGIPGNNVDMWADLDETVPNDTNAIRSGATPSNDTYTCALSSLATPGAGDVIVRVRARYC
jgi:hypothetical protein